VKREAVNWEAARAQLPDVLSPNQIATLGEILQHRIHEWKRILLTTRLTAEFNANLPEK
jgi:hypothetical protein